MKVTPPVDMKREIRGERRQQTGEQEEKDSSGQEKVAPKIMPTSEYEAKPLLGSLAAINGVHILKVVGKICGVLCVCLCVCVCVCARTSTYYAFQVHTHAACLLALGTLNTEDLALPNVKVPILVPLGDLLMTSVTWAMTLFAASVATSS